MTGTAGSGGLSGGWRGQPGPAAGKVAARHTLARNDGELLDTATEIFGSPPSGNETAFTHTSFCQVDPPRSGVEGFATVANWVCRWLFVVDIGGRRCFLFSTLLFCAVFSFPQDAQASCFLP